MSESQQKLDDETVARMLADLSAHFGEPVMPASRFCGKMRAWFRAVHDGAAREKAEQHWSNSLQALSGAIYAVDLAITKSACLARLIYGGEDIRTEQCPVHKGRWSGCAWRSPECATSEYPDGCMDGSNVTGWLPLPSVAERQREWHASRPHEACADCGKRYHKSPAGASCPHCDDRSFNFPCRCAA